MTDTFRQESLISKDLEAEQAVLGAIIENNDLLLELDFLTPNSFFSIAHQYIYRSILILFSDGMAIDEVIIGDSLKEKSQLEEIGGYSYLAELVECCPSGGNIALYGKIIQEHARQRDLRALLSESIEKISDPEIKQNEIIENLLNQFNNFTETGDRTKTIKQAMGDYFRSLEADDEKMITTGFIDLDKKIVGLEASDYIIIAARPGVGKTSLATNICNHVSAKGEYCMIFSLEMSAEQITEKIAGQETKIPLMKLRTKNLLQDDWDKLAMVSDKLAKTNSIIINDQSAISIPQLRSLAMKQHKKTPLSLIIIDYIQLMSGSSTAEKQGIHAKTTEISNGIKNLAKDLNLPIIALSQLNRKCEDRKNKRPMLSDLKDSGSLEADADVIIFIYRDEYYDSNSNNKGMGEIIIAKQRRGPIGTVDLAFRKEIASFDNLSKYQQ
jgi:replicative DNA helicase